MGDQAQDWGYGVTTTSDGNITAAGFTKTWGAGESDVYLAKVDMLGDTLWMATYAVGTATDLFYCAHETSNGEIIASLVDDEVAAGSHTIGWDGRDASGQKVSPGIYYVRFRAGAASTSEKVVLIR